MDGRWGNRKTIDTFIWHRENMVKILQLANDRNPDVQLQIFLLVKPSSFSQALISCTMYVHVHVHILNHFFTRITIVYSLSFIKHNKSP